MSLKLKDQRKHELVLISIMVFLGAILVFQQIEIARLGKETKDALESSESALVKAKGATNDAKEARNIAEEAKSVAEEAKSTADDVMYNYGY